MSGLPKISVITVNLNNRPGLEATVASVLTQTCIPQLVVIDGGSDDGSREVIVANEKSIGYWVSERDGGIYEAMNKGISRAEGEYILFLNSGDTLVNEKVLEQAAILLNKTDIVSGDLVIHERGMVYNAKSEDEVSIATFQRISLYHQATFIHRSLFERFGVYDPSFRIAGDMDFFIRVLLREGCSYAHIPLIICDYHADGISNQPALLQLNMAERRRCWEKNFSAPVLRSLDELADLKGSKFFWIFRRTRSKGFFYYFFMFWTRFFTAGLKVLEKMRGTR